MRFFSTLLVGASAIVSLASAQTQPFFTWQVPAAVKAGETYNVTYSAATDAPVTIILRKGPSNNLATLATLTSSATGGSYLWTPAKDLAEGSDYALQIKQGSADNYSKQFTLSGGSAPSSSASTTGSVTSSASASASTNATSSTLSTTHSGNSTASATGSSTRSAQSSSATGATSTGASKTASASGGAPTTGAASNLKSPMALVFGAVAAMVYLH